MLKLLLSFKYALNGIKNLIETEKNFKIQLLLALTTLILGFYFNISKSEWILIIICFASVLTAEAFNSAIEKLVDLVSPDYNEKAGKIKDIAAGAVLITALNTAIIGMIIFIPKILNRFYVLF
ncbi:MAG: diacylglycerol kinase family protein [Bacteroidota bacterium]